MRRNLTKWQQNGKQEKKDYIILKRGGAVYVKAKNQTFDFNFFAHNGKVRTVEVMLSPKEYEVLELCERNHFIEIAVKKENDESFIYFTHSGNFVAMGSKASFVVKNGGVFITSRCGSLYSELSLYKLYM